MRILYDGCIYKFQRAGGINRYLASLIQNLPADWVPVLALHDARAITLPTHPNLSVKRFPVPRLRPQRLAQWASERFFTHLESKPGFGLIHSTYQISLAGKRLPRRRAPCVLTIHDMIPEIFREDMDPEGVEAEIKRQAVEAADAVICVSQNTKKDLLERIPVEENKVFVTPLASELSPDMALGDEPVPCFPYFLFVGSRNLYKNFVRTVLAFGQLAQKLPEITLAVVGLPFDRTELGLFRALNIQERVVNFSGIQDRRLAKLYRCSVALVYPSLYEGFGIPPLEAMACGGVAITSTLSSLPEVTGGLSIPVNPLLIDSIAQGMHEALGLSSSRRQELIKQGTAWSSRFSWAETARRTIEIYQSVTR